MLNKIEKTYSKGTPFFKKGFLWSTEMNGFTLIEMLVVVAIVGLFASIIFSSVKNAREIAADASIKSEFAQIRPLAVLYKAEHGRYGPVYMSGGEPTACPTNNIGPSLFEDKGIQAVLAGIRSKIPAGRVINCMAAGTPLLLSSLATSWAISGYILGPSHADVAWCIDSDSYNNYGVIGVDQNKAHCVTEGGGGGTGN